MQRTATPLILCLILSACAPTGRAPMADAAGQAVPPATPEAPAKVGRSADTLNEPRAEHDTPMVSAPAAVAAPRQRALESLAMKGEAKLMRVMPHPMPSIAPPQPVDRERYQGITTNPVHQVATAPVSTFSIDVDTGSWSNLRRFLNEGRLPPSDAVRVEECINYFPYDDAPPTGNTPFAVHTELAQSPWNPERLLMRVALKGQDIGKQTLPPANLVFLVDVSGSMRSANKLPLLKSSLKLLVQQLRAQDRISLVTYAGASGLALPATSGSDKATILAAIDALNAGGSTAGASGIELAYQTAQAGFVQGGINRILLATDGDFNVGQTNFEQLKARVEQLRATGVQLTTLGFGTGNYNEQLMEQMADAGNGAYAYIDTLMEGHKVLVNEMSSTLVTIAKDVKIQVEFNPAAVSEYRLIGYENRMLRREDFNNDKIDAGEIGAGHSVTALYELTPAGQRGLIDPLRYGSDPRPGAATVARSAELAHVRLRYKRPHASTSQLIEHPVRREATRSISATSDNFRFASAIAGFGQILRGGSYTGQWSVADARALAATALGTDQFGYRGEALRLMDLAAALSPQPPQATAPLE
ncbi:vWA domain-containing protein [Denitromonas halophila]|uniref:VWA domain-containing protein n=1 Tax=Denitromonas halophila TaxID=1629404 RepID=A0A557QFC8_9RHOO|nr:VWA domain-containing protein [Denitromonas halophila]TVO51606.1 VWA domain-containing protein [Denitromonas halophila]